jgi:hypothetical protein
VEQEVPTRQQDVGTSEAAHAWSWASLVPLHRKPPVDPAKPAGTYQGSWLILEVPPNKHGLPTYGRATRTTSPTRTV